MSTRSWRIIRTGLIAVIIVGLAIDAYVHFNLASSYDLVRSSVLSEGDLFRVEAALAIVAAAALLVRPRWYTAAFALAVSAGGVFAVLLYTYVDVGAVGPLPDMYEPVWFGQKTGSLWGEAIAAGAALALTIGMRVTATHKRTAAEWPTADLREPVHQ